MTHSKGDSSSFNGLTSLTRHDEYFLNGGDLYLMVSLPDHRDNQ